MAVVINGIDPALLQDAAPLSYYQNDGNRNQLRLLPNLVFLRSAGLDAKEAFGRENLTFVASSCPGFVGLGSVRTAHQPLAYHDAYREFSSTVISPYKRNCAAGLQENVLVTLRSLGVTKMPRPDQYTNHITLTHPELISRLSDFEHALKSKAWKEEVESSPLAQHKMALIFFMMFSEHSDLPVQWCVSWWPHSLL